MCIRLTAMLVDHGFADARKGASGHLRVGSRTGDSTRHITAMGH